MAIKELQIGKQGITDNFVETLKTYFNKVKTVKVSVLSSARESKDDVKKMAKDLLARLGPHFTSKVIGFTIVLKKWRRARN